MTKQEPESALEPFFVGPYCRVQRAPISGVRVPTLPTPLLDPRSLQIAIQAYDHAVSALRLRSRAGLRPAVRYMLANRVLSFAIFGERDPRSLASRALAHFP